MTSTYGGDVDLDLSNNSCAVIQVATNDIAILFGAFIRHRPKCEVHFSSVTADTSITKITGEFNKLIVKLPFAHGLELYQMRKTYFCKETSKKFCVKDDLGFTMPHLKSKYVIPNESRSSTFQINIQPSKYELITDVKIYIQEFSKSWLNIVLEKVAMGTEIQFNQIAQILSTANHSIFLPYPTITVRKCSITLQVNNISHPHMDDIFLHVTYHQLILNWRYASLGLVSKYNDLHNLIQSFSYPPEYTNHTIFSSGSSGKVGEGWRNMKFIRPLSVAICFITYFYRAEGGMAPLSLPR